MTGFNFCPVKNTDYQQCTRCVMDTSDPIIVFNEKGECNHCAEFIEKRSLHKYQGVTKKKN